MYLQDNDPHHLHPDINYVYYFLIPGAILLAAMVFGGAKLMNYLDSRYERKKPSEKGFRTGEDK